MAIGTDDDPIYGGNKGKRDSDTAVDAVTLGLGGARAQSAREAGASRIAGTQLPTYSNASYQAPGYSGDFNPTMYSDPQAAAYKTVVEDPRTRDMQMQALQRLQQYGDQAANSQEALGRFNAVNDANAMAAQREQAIRQQMQMRGQGGSAAEFVMGQGASQDAANRAQSGGMNAAMQAALQRLQGTQAAFAGAGQLRGQDFANQAANNDVINAFNMHNTDALNATRNANTGLSNSAGLRNLDARQTGMNNTANAGNMNLTRSDTNANSMFNNSLTKNTGVANALNGIAGGAEKQGEGWQKAAGTAAKMFGAGMA